MTDFSRSYASRWEVKKVNQETWEDSEAVSGFISASVERSVGSLVESGKYTIDVADDFDEGYYRLVLYATQDGTTERHDITTLLCMSTSDSTERGSTVRDIVGQSVLYPASVRRVMPCTYIMAGSDGCQFAADMLREAIVAPVHTEGSFAVGTDVVFDINATYLECVYMVLDSGGFCMVTDGRGEVTIRPIPTEISATVSPTHLMPKSSGDMSTAAVPNRYMAMEGGTIAVAVNDSPDSPVSTVSRGYVRDPDDGIDQSPIRLGGETLDGYCKRRLAELSNITVTRSYDREYHGHVRPMDLISGPIGTDHENVVARVQNQSLSCDKGITVSERAAMEVSLW